MKKRIIAFLLAASFVLSVSACSAKKEEAYASGKVENTTYTNEFFKIKVEAPEDMSFASDEEIKQLGLATAEVFGKSDEEIAKALEGGNAVTEMYLSDVVGLTTANVNVSDLGASTSKITSEDVIDSAIPQITKMFEGSGFENITCVRATTRFLGKEVPCLELHATLAGNEFNEKQVEILKGRYMMAYTVVSYGEDKTDALLDLVSSIE